MTQIRQRIERLELERDPPRTLIVVKDALETSEAAWRRRYGDEPIPAGVHVVYVTTGVPRTDA